MIHTIEIYDEIYSFIESSLPISELTNLRKLFIIKNLYKELFLSDLLSREEMLSLKKKLELLFLDYKSDMLNIQEITGEMQRILLLFQERDMKKKCFLQLHSFFQQVLPTNTQSQKLIEEKVFQLNQLIKNPKLSEFEILKLMKTLEKMEKIFEQHVHYSQAEFLDSLEKMIETYKVS